MSLSVCLFPGSFDPPTVGHLDVIRRASALFDRVCVAVMANTAKKPLLTAGERIDLLRLCCRDLDKVEVFMGQGLTVETARACGADVLLRGIRGGADSEQEAQMAALNRHVDGIDTVALFTAPEYSFVSSTFVRDILRYGGDLQGLVPDAIIPALERLRTDA